MKLMMGSTRNRRQHRAWGTSMSSTRIWRFDLHSSVRKKSRVSHSWRQGMGSQGFDLLFSCGNPPGKNKQNSQSYDLLHPLRGGRHPPRDRRDCYMGTL